MITNRENIQVGDTVTDGDVTGIVTAVFVSYDDLNNPNLCLDVKLPKGQTDFKCTRIDWWRKA